MKHHYTTVEFLGGNNKDKIGANAQLLTHQDETGNITRILFDLGALFFQSERENLSFTPDILKYLVYLPNKNNQSPLLKKYYLEERAKFNKYPQKPLLDAVFLTHMHEDHIGGLVNLIKAGFLFPPIYASLETLSVLSRILIEHNVENMPEMHPISGPVHLSKNVIVTPFMVSHTVAGALGFHTLTKYDGKEYAGLLHLGDFNLSDVIVGTGYQKEAFKNLINSLFITHVFMDSTSSFNLDEKQLTFQESVQNYKKIMTQSSKRIITAVISRSTQNMASILKAAQESGRTVFIDGFMQRLVYDSLKQYGFMDAFQGTVYQHEDVTKGDISSYIKDIPLSKQVVILSGAFAEGFSNTQTGAQQSGLVKVAKGVHSHLKLDERSLVVLSQRAIPVPSIVNDMQQMVEKLAQLSSNQVIQNKAPDSKSLGDFEMVPLQRTGHASLSEIKEILTDIRLYRKNKEDKLFLIPVHGDKAQLEQTLSVSEQTGVLGVLAENDTLLGLSAHDVISQPTLKAKKRWLSFEEASDGVGLTQSAFKIDLYEETEQNGQVVYQKVQSLGAQRVQILANKNKALLKRILYHTLERYKS